MPASADGSVTETVAVDGMHCPSCGLLVDETLEALRGVFAARTRVRRGHTVVKYDPGLVSRAEIVAAVQRLGYEARESSPVSDRGSR
jgi:copper chaperone CopZ